MDVFGRLGRRKIVLASLLLSWLTLSSCARTPAPSAATLTPQRLPATWTPQPEVAASATPTPVLTNALSTEPPTPLAGPATASPMSGSTRPEPIALLPVGSSLNINRMQMMDADRGWAIGTGDAGADSHILRTQDGGLTWADVSPPELVSLDDAFTHRANGFFLDAQTAWVVYTPIATFGANTVAPKTIWRTQDGGLAWQPSAIWQSTAIGTTCWDDLTFVDANLGWYLFDCWQAMGSYVSELFRTLDGGNTWELIEQHGLTHHTGMRFLGREGWVSRNSHFWDGLFLDISFDQGLTWQEQQLPFPDGSLDPTQYLNCGVFSPELDTPRSGSLVVRCPAYQPGDDYLYRTRDGGSNWQILNLPGREVFFLDPETGWALGAGPPDSDEGVSDVSRPLFRTQDGGQTWTEIARLAGPSTFQFLDKESGWALAQTGDVTTLLRTSDGGRTWSPLVAPVVEAQLGPDRPVPPRVDLPAELLPLTRSNLGEIQMLQAQPAEGATDLAISPRGDQLALAHQDGWVSLWDLAGASYAQKILLHKDWVYDVRYAPEGGALASASKDGSARIVLRYGDCHAGPIFAGHQGEVTGAALHAGLLATGSQDGTIALSGWDADCGEAVTSLRKRLEGHSGWVWDVAFSPDGERLASASSDRTVRLWDLSSDEAVTALAGHFDRVREVIWSPDGTRLVTLSEADIGGLWDASSGQVISELGEVFSVAWSPDGRLVALFDDRANLRIWDAASGTQHAALQHPDLVTRATWSPDGEKLASGALDGVIRLWDATSGDLLLALAGHTDWVSELAWSSDGALLATSAADDTWRLWDAATGTSIGVFPLRENIIHLAWSPDASRLAALYGNGTVGLWSLVFGQQQVLIEEESSFIRSVAWSPDGQSLAGFDIHGALMLWDGADGKPLAALDAVSSFVWNPEGRLLAAASRGDRVELWDVYDGERLAEIHPADRYTSEAILSPDGFRLATRSQDGVVQIWLAGSGIETAYLEDVDSIVWSPDGTSLAAFTGNLPVRLWDVATGAFRAVIEHPDWAREVLWPPESVTLEGHAATVWRVAFSPDGQTLASASWDRTVRLWDVPEGRPLHNLTGHSDWVRAVAFSPDGILLASGSEDGTVILWDARTGEALGTLAIGASVYGLGFTPDGRVLVTITDEGLLEFWGVVP